MNCGVITRRRVGSIVALGWLVLLVLVAPVHGQDIASAFPSADQVATDYPDEVQRYIALNALWNCMHVKAPDDPAARQVRKKYYESSTAIRQHYLIAGGAQGQDFDDRVRQTDTSSFERSVLQRYHVLDVAAESVAQPMANGDVTDDMIKGAFLAASPFAIGGLVLMYGLTYLLSRGTSKARPLPVVPGAADLPELPEPLRIVKVPGMAYAVGTLSGLVLDKETTVRTTTTTTHMPGQTEVVNNQVIHTPGQTHVNTTSTKIDTIWVRLADGLEASWTFTASDFQVRPGHVISALHWRQADGALPFLVAYNHATGQFIQVSAPPHGARGCLAWMLSFVIGTIAFGIAIGVILAIDHNVSAVDQQLMPVVCLIMGAAVSLLVSLFVSIIVGNRIIKRRNAAFARDYLPAYRQIFQASTPELKRRFGVGSRG